MKIPVKKILLVDDDADDREFFQTALKSINETIELVFAFDGIDALEKLSTFKPDLIFLDLVMPRLEGFECFRRILKIEDLKSVPVVILTNFSDDAAKAEAKELGAIKFITKPPTIEKIVAEIEELIVC